MKTVDVDDLVKQLAEARTAALRWKERAAQHHRRVLSVDVLKQLFEHRARTLPARAAIPSREQREAALRAVSPEYAASAAEGPASLGAHVHRKTLYGLQWWMPVVRPRPAGPKDTWIAKHDFPFRTLTQTREVAVGGIMLDLGANIGAMSVPRVVLGDVVAAYCAEPDPLNYTCLVANVVDNGLQGLVLPDRVAIGDRNGTVRLRRAKVSGGHQVLADGDAGAATAEDVIDVPSLTLDSWLTRLQVDPDAVTFVKADVQGFEMRVLAGAGTLLARGHVAWQLEIYPALLAESGASLADIVMKLQRHFSKFIDLNGELTGPRERPASELPEALAYVGASASKTDILVWGSGQ
jgi:FkbM family methyltransferase